jgi:hypothetical protein
MTGSSSKTKTKRFKFDKEFTAIQETTAAILREALGATIDQRQFQTALFGLLQPEFERLARENDIADELGSGEARQQLLRDSIDRNLKLSEQAATLSDKLTESAVNLGTLTDDDRALISSAIGNARAIGQHEIDQFVEGNFRAGNEVAAARGFRPTDAPIGNIRGRVAEEATAQKGLLESQLATQASQLALDLPMQRTALLGNVSAGQTGLAQAGNQFQAALAQNAAANRLNLAGTAGQLGLGLTGLASTGPGVLGASRPALGTFSSSASGGISTKTLKINGREIDSAEVLRRMQSLPIEAWQYVWEHGEEAFQVGPYAEDFKEAFGGESFQISFLHALGVSMVSVQELAGRLDRLEAFVGVGMEPAEELLESVEELLGAD